MKFYCLFCGNPISWHQEIFFNAQTALHCSRCGATVDIQVRKKITLELRRDSHPTPISEGQPSH